MFKLLGLVDENGKYRRQRAGTIVSIWIVLFSMIGIGLYYTTMFFMPNEKVIEVPIPLDYQSILSQAQYLPETPEMYLEDATGDYLLDGLYSDVYYNYESLAFLSEFHATVHFYASVAEDVMYKYSLHLLADDSFGETLYAYDLVDISSTSLTFVGQKLPFFKTPSPNFAFIVMLGFFANVFWHIRTQLRGQWTE